MRVVLMIALLASCDGRCRPVESASDEVPGAWCAASFDSNSALCLRGSELFTCSIAGFGWHEAVCVRAGTVTP